MHPFCKKISEGYQPEFQEIITELGIFFPLLKKLVNTPQDPEWHAEGDVCTHTSMVLSALYSLINAHGQNLTSDKRLALILAAALHDIAKPLSTRTMEIRGVQRIADCSP